MGMACGRDLERRTVVGYIDAPRAACMNACRGYTRGIGLGRMGAPDREIRESETPPHSAREVWIVPIKRERWVREGTRWDGMGWDGTSWWVGK